MSVWASGPPPTPLNSMSAAGSIWSRPCSSLARAYVPERAPVDDAARGREPAVEVGGHAVGDDLGVRGEARALAPGPAPETPSAVPPGG